MARLPDRPAKDDRAARVLPLMSVADSLGFLFAVVAPSVLKGVIIRRPAGVALAAYLDLDRRSVRRMSRLRDKYGDGPVAVRNPVKPEVVILAPKHVSEILAGTPDPYSPASDEKVSSLSHFEPHTSLITRGPQRGPRRAFSDEALDSNCPRHRLAERFRAVVRDEAERLLSQIPPEAELAWPDFTATWWRVVRRVILGDNAADDVRLTDMLARLRANANWAFARSQEKDLRASFLARLDDYLARPGRASLAEIIAGMQPTADIAPAEQVSQWLFAFDAGGVASFYALALLASHPAQARSARQELRRRDAVSELPYLRACFVEAIRLWPTTPVVLRQATRSVDLDGVLIPAGASIMIFAPYFHRDAALMGADADRFNPSRWLGRDLATEAPLIPFSARPAACPGRNLVTMLAAEMLACLIGAGDVEVVRGTSLDPDRELPASLNHFDLHFRFQSHPGASASRQPLGNQIT
jgi:cytochrome P450